MLDVKTTNKKNGFRILTYKKDKDIEITFSFLNILIFNWIKPLFKMDWSQYLSSECPCGVQHLLLPLAPPTLQLNYVNLENNMKRGN